MLYLEKLLKEESSWIRKLTSFKDQYYVLRKARDDEANKLYLEMIEEESDGLYIQDIMRGGIKNDDPRIPRNISE